MWVKEIKEESLEGHMGGIPWKASQNIFSYVFSQCGMKIPKKTRQDLSYVLYECMRDTAFKTKREWSSLISK